MKIYYVSGKTPGGGRYIPPDPCAGGGYYADKHIQHFITAENAEAAKLAFKAVFQNAVSVSAKCVSRPGVARK